MELVDELKALAGKPEQEFEAPAVNEELRDKVFAFQDQLMAAQRTEGKHERQGTEVDRTRLDAMERKIIDQFDRESTPYYATAHLWDDGIVDPRDTRRILAFLLDTCAEAEARAPNSSTFGVARL